MKKQIKLVLLFTCIFSVLFSTSAFAYQYWGPILFRYKMVNGIGSGVYWNFATNGTPHNGTSYYFKSSYYEAMYEWNSKTKANINDGMTSSGTTKLDLYQGHWGNIGLFGWAEFYRNGSLISGPQGSAGPSGSWDQAIARLNFGDINLYNLSYAEYTAIAIHEVGHCLGLAHEDNGTPTVMHSFPVSKGWLNVKQDDINGVNNLY